MEKQDLRIGITLYDSVRDKNIEIESKHFKELFIAENNFFDRYKAIELDEEWFLKFGFEKHERNPFWFRKGNLMVGLIGVAEMMNELGSTVRISTWINNVHQLQNLYQSLFGEDLKIKN